MSPDALPIHARDLLDHQEFVRALSKSLLRDEHAAQDVAQETWLAYLTHPPRSIESLRGWLAQVTRNRVRNAAREQERRHGREAFAARREADDSTAGLHERLELQHRVVAVVLALREPYKTVIVLTYYDGLSASQIASRLKTPAGTVRAQLSRAHEMLRQKLDTECDGGRSAWSVGLAGILARAEPSAIGAKLGLTTKILAASLLVGGVVIPLAWWWIHDVPSRVIGMNQYGHVVSDGAIVNSAPEPSEGEELSERASSSRVPVNGPADSIGSVAQNAKTPALDEMLTEARQIQLLLRGRLLTPDPVVVRARRDLAALPGIHFARLWNRGALGADSNNAVGLRGAGSYLSFATGVQDYDHQPDLGLESGFNSSFYGGTAGAVLRLEGTRLADLVNERSPRPDSVSDAAWNTIWEASNAGEREIPAAFSDRLRQLNHADRPGVMQGATYILRSTMPGEHDLVGAFEVIARDQKSATIAWRVLKQWEIPVAVGRDVADVLAGVAPPSPSLSALSTEALMNRRKALLEKAAHLILDVPEKLDPASAKVAQLAGVRMARIVERGRWDSLLSLDGGGAYWSFTKRSNDYQQEAQIELQRGRFTSGFAGRDRGYVLDLGDVPIDRVSLRATPPGLDERGKEAFVFLRDLTPVPMAEDRTALEVSAEDNDRAHKLGLTYGAQASLGHSYLVRSVITDKQDVLAAFQVVASDDAALTLAWKILQQKPASR